MLGLCECELLRFSCFGSPLLSGHRRYGSRLRTRRLDRVFLGGFLDGGLCALLRKRQELFENLGFCSFVGNFCRSACAATDDPHPCCRNANGGEKNQELEHSVPADPGGGYWP